MKLSELNAMSHARAREELVRCCAASAWVDSVVESRPFADRAALLAASNRAARALTRRDWLEAFAGHPRIGDAAALREKFANTAVWAGAEQQGAMGAPASVLEALVRGNHAYEARFGYVFIVCATGKHADEMLALLESRLSNDPARELDIAAAEQMKITHIRLDKLLEES